MAQLRDPSITKHIFYQLHYPQSKRQRATLAMAAILTSPTPSESTVIVTTIWSIQTTKPNIIDTITLTKEDIPHYMIVNAKCQLYIITKINGKIIK